MDKDIQVDVRIVASSNRDLMEEVKEKNFREDLYYRLNVFPIQLPALRERGDDILLLARIFLDEYNESFNLGIKGFSESGRRYLLQHAWPGNVRELRHTIERAVILARSDTLEVGDLCLPQEKPALAGASGDETLSDYLDRMTSEFVLNALENKGWNHMAVADKLDVNRSTLYRLLKKHRIKNPLSEGKEEELEEEA